MQRLTKGLNTLYSTAPLFEGAYFKLPLKAPKLITNKL